MTPEEEKLLAEQLDKAIRSTDFWTLAGREIQIIASWDKQPEEATAGAFPARDPT